MTLDFFVLRSKFFCARIYFIAILMVVDVSRNLVLFNPEINLTKVNGYARP